MLHRRFFLTVPLLALGLLSSVALAAGADSPAADPGRPGGPIAGQFHVPASGLPGQAAGVLLDRIHGPVFAFQTAVLPLGPYGRGLLVGAAVHLGGPHQGEFVPLQGSWQPTAPGNGEFRAVLLRPVPGDDGRPRLEPFVALHGGYRTLDGTDATTGIIHGRWGPLP
ncbi:MAG: hypothetical protein AB1726_11210 [Planctomycetota bacterium]